MTREEFMDMVYSELHSDGDNYRANRIIDAADEYVETEKESNWIPVSEGLPESSVYVLVTTNDGIITTGIIRESNNEKFWWHRMHEFKEKEIVAWMPLPEPYEAESEGRK